jgi:hypothetical protein
MVRDFFLVKRVYQKKTSNPESEYGGCYIAAFDKAQKLKPTAAGKMRYADNADVIDAAYDAAFLR